jgi:hypothetical protein
MNVEIEAALLGAAVATLGSWIFAIMQDWQRARTERRTVANLLLVELMAQAEFVSVLANACHIENALALKETFIRFVPPYPVVYRALANKIGHLDVRSSNAIVAFYGAISWAETLVGALPNTTTYAGARVGPHIAPSTPEFGSASQAAKLVDAQTAGLIDRLQQAARGACFNAILAIRALDDIASYNKLPNDETAMTELLGKLEKAAELVSRIRPANPPDVVKSGQNSH